MANVVKDEEYLKRKEEFTEKLLAFHRMKGNPIRRFPLLGGRELDLYHLYTKVQQLGGSFVVTKERNWGEVSRSFNLPSTVTSASYACRQNFLKYLVEFEEIENKGLDPTNHPRPSISLIQQPRVPSPTGHVTFTNPHSASSAPPISSTTPSVNSKISRNSFSTLSSHLPNLLALPGLQGLGNLLDQLSKAPNQLQILSSMLQLPPNQVQLLELLLQQHQQRQQSKVLEATRSDWLVRSLQSGFPNEVDFAMNSLLVMSSDNKGILPINKVPHLVDVLLAHIGVFSKEDPYLEVLYREEWHSGDDGQDYHRMWQETTPEHIYYNIMDKMNSQDTGGDYFHLFPCKSIMSEENVESLHVSQVAMVMRNLSFDEVNAMFFSSHEETLRFLLLGINCSLPMVQSCCLDTLNNIAPHVLLNTLSTDSSEDEESEKESIGDLLMTSLHDLILSENRLCVLRGIECLGSLAYSPSNNSFLNRVHPEVYQRMLQYLLLPDIQLILTCLDTLYCLTYSGRPITETLLECNHCVSILVHMVLFKFDGQQTNAVGGLTLLHPDGKEEPVEASSKGSKDKNTKKSKASNTNAANTASLMRTTTSASTNRQTNVAATPSATTVVTATSSAGAGTPHRLKPAKLKQSKVQLTNRFTQGVVDENKHSFGKQWLQSFYEPNSDEFVSKREMYSNYLTSCAQLKIMTAATQSEFDSILKETFPNANFTTVKLSGHDIQLVSGVTRKFIQSGTAAQQSSNNSSKQSESSTSRGGTSSPTPSRSPSPSPALSPLQQLIQQTKTKTLATPSSASVAKASPLLVSNKMTPTTTANQVSKTGSTGNLKNGNKVDSQLIENHSRSSSPNSEILINKNKGNNNKQPLSANGSSIPVVHMNGNASDVEMEALSQRESRKRPLDETEDGPVSRKIPRIDSTEHSNNSSKPITHPMESHGSNDTNRTPPTITPTSTCTSNVDKPSSSSSSFRSASLPPSMNKLPQKNLSTATAPRPEKARSLTPPLTTSAVPSKNITAEQLLDSMKLVRQVSATSMMSLPGSTSSSSLSSGGSKAIVCLWKNCQRIKKTLDDLFYHIMYDHLLSSGSSQPVYSLCEWRGCLSKARRMLPSLLRHVQTHHCSNGCKPVTPNVAQTLLKLRTVPSWESEDESSITKSVRLTAALVLRNIVETVPHAELCISPYEPVLCQIALSTSEASSTIARCLSLFTKAPNRQRLSSSESPPPTTANKHTHSLTPPPVHSVNNTPLPN